jgi:hypothetical protein
MRKLISLRPPEMGTVPYEPIETHDPGVLGFKRGSITIHANFTNSVRSVECKGGKVVAGRAEITASTVTLEPYGWVWIEDVRPLSSQPDSP